MERIGRDFYLQFCLFHHSFFRLRISSPDQGKFKETLQNYFSNYIPIIEARLKSPSALGSLGKI
jgi:hypothetical protein